MGYKNKSTKCYLKQQLPILSSSRTNTDKRRRLERLKQLELYMNHFSRSIAVLREKVEMLHAKNQVALRTSGQSFEEEVPITNPEAVELVRDGKQAIENFVLLLNVTFNLMSDEMKE
eukprot:snap_masked-scaffold_68-processed-gene-0.56-mRNA-1 protein AED:1.00 eAED:1.00 QI:0/-1/0/0/-1/1/1/0/116